MLDPGGAHYEIALRLVGKGHEVSYDKPLWLPDRCCERRWQLSGRDLAGSSQRFGQGSQVLAPSTRIA